MPLEWHESPVLELRKTSQETFAAAQKSSSQAHDSGTHTGRGRHAWSLRYVSFCSLRVVCGSATMGFAPTSSSTSGAFSLYKTPPYCILTSVYLGYRDRERTAALSSVPSTSTSTSLSASSTRLSQPSSPFTLPPAFTRQSRSTSVSLFGQGTSPRLLFTRSRRMVSSRCVLCLCEPIRAHTGPFLCRLTRSLVTEA